MEKNRWQTSMVSVSDNQPAIKSGSRVIGSVNEIAMPTPEEIDADIIGMLKTLHDKIEKVYERMAQYDVFFDNLIDRVDLTEKQITGLKQQFLFWLNGRDYRA